MTGNQEQSVKWWISIVILTTVYLVPFNFASRGTGGIYIESMTWRLVFIPDPYYFVCGFANLFTSLIELLPAYLFFHLFAIRWYRLYQGKASVRSTLALGVLTVVPYLFIVIMTVLPSL